MTSAVPGSRESSLRAGRTTRWRSGLSALAFVGLLLVINAAAQFLPDEIDLTRQATYTLAPQTRSLLENLDRPVVVSLLSVREPRSAADREFAQAAVLLRELLEQYRQAAPAIQVRDLDPQTSDEARQLLQRYPDVVPPCAVLEMGDAQAAGHEVLYARDLAAVHGGNEDRAAVVEFFGEQAVTAALVRLTGGRKQTRIAVLTGHGELTLDDHDVHSRQGLGRLQDRLQELDIELRPLDLKRDARVPTGTDIVLVPGGEQPLSAEAERALRRFWDHGGRGLVLCDLSYDSRNGSVVDAGWRRLLADYDVELGIDRVIWQGVTGTIDAAIRATPSHEDHPLVRSLPQAPVQFFECRSVRQRIGVSRSTLRTTPLLVSPPAPESWAEGDFSSTEAPNPDGENDVPGPVSLALAVERRQGSLHEPVLVVVGDSEFVDNRALDSPNGRSGFSFVLTCLNWLRGRRDLMGDIPPRRNEGHRLTGTPAEQRGLVWKPTLLLSALLTTAAASVWISRRRG